MKKIYSIVLMATALLIGTNAWANDVFDDLASQQGENTVKVTIGGTTKYAADLQTAVNAVAAGETATIQLLATQLLEAPVIIPQLPNTLVDDEEKVANRARQNITLDLNTFSVEPKTGYMGPAFMLFKGVLDVIGTGNIKRSGNPTSAPSNINASAIVIFGADGDRRSGETDRSKQEWSTLKIGAGVNVQAEGEWVKNSKNYGAYGICIQNFGSSANMVNVYGINPANFGYYTYYTQATTPKGQDKMWWTGSANNGSAFGVKIIISGTVYGTQRGINVLGTINQSPKDVEGATKRIKSDYPYYEHYYPYIKVEENAMVYCNDGKDRQLESGNGGIYGGGWCIYDITGDVHGQTGVYLKAGDAVVSDKGHVYSSSDANLTNANYGGNVAGNGIFIASASNYAGSTNVSIEGNAKIEGNGGAAIIDALASNTTETTVENIQIKGGTIVGGQAGAIVVTPETAGNGKATVYDVNLEGNTNVETGTTNGLLDLLVKDENGDANAYVTTTKDENDKTVLVVTSGAGSAPAVVANDFDIDNFNNLGDVNLSDAGLSNKNQVFDSETKSKLEIGTLMMNNTTDVVKLTIAAGHTIVAQKVIMSPKAQIIVEPGASLIVTGHAGINAPVVDNIILKHNSNTGKYATFLFNPAVTSNQHPKATVEFSTNSWSVDSENHQWEWFGIPTYTTATSITSTVSEGTKYYATVQVFENNTWSNLGYIGGTYDNNPAVLAKLNKPFAAYNLLAYRTQSEVAPKITIAGELVGNMDASIYANMRWNTFANSYTAEIDATTMLNYFKTNSSNIVPTVYVATQNHNGTLTWSAKDDETVAEQNYKLKPMQGFLLNNPNNIEETAINYASMVYDPAVPGSAGAPRRYAPVNSNTARVIVNVANENGTWDDVEIRENVNTKVCEKYLNSDINIYVLDGEKNDIVAVEDIENTFVGFSTVKGGNFTISFTRAEGKDLTLVDLETGVQTLMVEGNTYTFNAAANTTNDYRFQIINTNGIMTGIENAEAAKSAKGIYTITGIYVGEMNLWNTLPAGVYVVNGEKRVK